MDSDLEDNYSDETEEERLSEDILSDLDDISMETVNMICDRMLVVVDEFSGIPLYPYQKQIARRIIESLIVGDGATITALQARQCLDESTIVFEQDGTATQIKDMKNATYTGVRPTKRYRLNGGSELVMTDEHYVFSEKDGIIPASRLNVGDRVSLLNYNNNWRGDLFVDRDIEVSKWKNKKRVTVKVTDDLAKWLGYMVTDGSVRPGQSPKFTNTSEKYLGEMEGLTKSLFGIDSKRYVKGNGYDLLLTTSKSSFDSPLLDLWKALDVDHKFPKDVFSWDPETVSHFVNRAWAGDGCVSMKKTGPDVFLAVGNDEVTAKYWQALLLKYGVHSIIKREHMSKGTGTFHRLVLSSGERNITQFFKSFGLIYGKEEQSQRAIDYFHNRVRSGKGTVKSGGRRMHPFNGYGPDGEELVWGRIVSIEDAGERHVYDPHVPGKGWVIAGGWQVSNSGKSEVVANTIAACMVMLPILSKVFPALLDKYSRGFWVGSFAPTEDQSDIVYSRIVSRLTSESALEFYSDPDIAQKVWKGYGTSMEMTNGSLVRRQTAHPRSNIEGRTYHLMLVDEAQDVEKRVISKSIAPMGASTNATMVFIGTPNYTKGAFYEQIQLNKRQEGRRGAKQNHFQFDWREVSKYNKNYEKFVRKEMLRIGEDADEFKLAYLCLWLLDKGMFVSSDKLERLQDKSMEVVHAWHRSPVLVGIDPARKQDSTIVTVIWVDWDRPDEFGLYEYRILNWLDLSGTNWEEQYYAIVSFLSNYNVMAIAVDSGGLGDPVIQRLQVLMPETEIIAVPSDRATQSKRWKHLKTLIDRERIGFPAHAKTRRLKVWKRFTQQFEDLEIKFEGPYVLAAAPRAADAHDDYMDSLALGLSIAEEYQVPEIEVGNNPFYSR